MNNQNYWLMKFRRNVSFLLVAITVATMFSLQTTHAQYIPAKPNIIVIMADDLDVGSLEMMLKLHLMPNFQSTFVDQGIKFTNSFVTNALCCPSRATFLSGQYTHNHQTFTNSSLNGSVARFDDTTALPTWLQAAPIGYRTAHVGKYLNLYGIITKPTYVPPGWSEWYGLIDPSTYCAYNYSMNANKHIVQYLKTGQVLKDGVEVSPPIKYGQLHNYQTDVLREYAEAFIRNNKNTGQPFFLSIMPLAPHAEGCGNLDPDGPTIGAKEYKDHFQYSIRPAPRHTDYVPRLQEIGATWLPKKKSFNILDAGKPEELQQKLNPLDLDDQEGLFKQYGNRLASLIAIDDLLGHVVTTLGDQLGNTVIMFTSDNGWFYGEHQLSLKLLAYEEAVRVPLYLRLPQPTDLREINRVVLNNDLAPTIAELAGANPTRMVDGRSLLPLIQNPATLWRKQFLIEHYLGTWPEEPHRLSDNANLFAVRTCPENNLPNRVYIEYYDGIQKKDGYYLSEDQTVPTGDFVWNGAVQDREYYNMSPSSDPQQMNNLLFDLDTNPKKQKILIESARLKRMLEQFHSCKGIACWQLENQ